MTIFLKLFFNLGVAISQSTFAHTLRRYFGFGTFLDKSQSVALEALKKRLRSALNDKNYQEAGWWITPAAVKVFRDVASEYVESRQNSLAIWCREEAVRRKPNCQVLYREYLRSMWQLGELEKALNRAQEFDFSEGDVNRSDLTPVEKLIFSVTGDIAIASVEAITTLVRATDYLVRANIGGAFVECGVFRGGSPMAMMLALQIRGKLDRDFYLYDTYEGMPEPESVDKYHNGRSAMSEYLEKRLPDGTSGWVNSSLEFTKRTVETVGYPKERVHYVKGLVEDTIPEHCPDQIALLRLDTDFYSSTKHELIHLYSRVVHRGIIIIDDYGVFEGSRKAVDEFFDELGAVPFLTRVDSNVRLLIKV
jgi:O-methyltransferase